MKKATWLAPTQRAQPNGSLVRLGSQAQGDWAREEFAPAPLPDQRLVKRLMIMAPDFALHPTAPIPQACGSWAKTKAAYRFFDHDDLTPKALLAAHVQATARRIAAHPIVLCVQDTTALNYSTHPQTQGLGPIGNNPDKTIGLLRHSTLALTPSGQPLGLQGRARNPGGIGQRLVERRRMARLDLLHGRTAPAAAPAADGAASGALDRATGRLLGTAARRRAGADRHRARLATTARDHGRVEKIWS